MFFLHFELTGRKNNWPLSRLALTQDKFLIIDSQQPGIDYTLLEEPVSKSACDYVESVCVCIVWAEVKRWPEITQNTSVLSLVVCLNVWAREWEEGYVFDHLTS